MKQKRELANSIIELVGGKANITNIFHCMTRLRFNLKDFGLVNERELQDLEGVIGLNETAGELQVIIGPGVESVYNEAIEITGIQRMDAIDELLDDVQEGKNKGIVQVLKGIMNAFSACMSPLIPLFVVMGIFNMIAVLIGPQFINIVSDKSDLYKNFYNVSQSILYFLPMLIAYTASKHFKSNTMISMALAGMLLYPAFTQSVASQTPYTIFGLSVPLVDYSTSILPMMLIPFVQAYIEKFLNRHVPDVIKVIVIPCTTILIMLPISLCVLGPIGNYIGIYMGMFMSWLYQVAGPLETALAGALSVFFIVFGASKPIFFISLTALMTNGVEYTYLPYAMALSNWIMMGAVVGYLLKEKNSKKRQFGLTAFTSLLLGGVSEPAVFGIFLMNKASLIATAIGGAVSGFYYGIMNVGYYSFGPSNFFNVIGFLGGPHSNFIHACIGAAIGFGLTLILMLALQKKYSN